MDEPLLPLQDQKSDELFETAKKRAAVCSVLLLGAAFANFLFVLAEWVHPGWPAEQTVFYQKSAVVFSFSAGLLKWASNAAANDGDVSRRAGVACVGVMLCLTTLTSTWSVCPDEYAYKRGKCYFVADVPALDPETQTLDAVDVVVVLVGCWVAFCLALGIWEITV